MLFETGRSWANSLMGFLMILGLDDDWMIDDQRKEGSTNVPRHYEK